MDGGVVDAGCVSAFGDHSEMQEQEVIFPYSPSTAYSKNKERQCSGLQCGHLFHSPGWSATVAMFVRHALLLTGAVT